MKIIITPLKPRDHIWNVETLTDDALIKEYNYLLASEMFELLKELAIEIKKRKLKNRKLKID
jgi:hypothetical protein